MSSQKGRLGNTLPQEEFQALSLSGVSEEMREDT